MKSLLTSFALCAVLCLSSCSTTGGGDSTAVASLAVSYGTARHLAGAKTLESYKARQADLGALAVVLSAANGQGLDPVALRNLLIQKFGSKPEVILLANLALIYYHPTAGAPKSELLTQVVLVLEAASMQSPPAF